MSITDEKKTKDIFQRVNYVFSLDSFRRSRLVVTNSGFRDMHDGTRKTPKTKTKISTITCFISKTTPCNSDLLKFAGIL